MPGRDIWWDGFIHKWVETVPCPCKDGYAGPDGHTCTRCSGERFYDIPSNGPIASLWDSDKEAEVL